MAENSPQAIAWRQRMFHSRAAADEVLVGDDDRVDMDEERNDTDEGADDYPYLEEKPVKWESALFDEERSRQFFLKLASADHSQRLETMRALYTAPGTTDMVVDYHRYGEVAELSVFNKHLIKLSSATSVWIKLFQFLNLQDKARAAATASHWAKVWYGADFKENMGPAKARPVKRKSDGEPVAVPKHVAGAPSAFFCSSDWMGFTYAGHLKKGDVDRWTIAYTDPVAIPAVSDQKALQQRLAETNGVRTLKNKISLKGLRYQIRCYEAEVDIDHVCMLAGKVDPAEWTLTVTSKVAYADGHFACRGKHTVHDHLAMLSRPISLSVPLHSFEPEFLALLDKIPVNNIWSIHLEIAREYRGAAEQLRALFAKWEDCIESIALYNWEPPTRDTGGTVSGLLALFPEKCKSVRKLALPVANHTSSTLYRFTQRQDDFSLGTDSLERFPDLRELYVDYVTLGNYTLARVFTHCPRLTRLDIGGALHNSWRRTISSEVHEIENLPEVERKRTYYFDTVCWRFPVSEVDHVRPFVVLLSWARAIHMAVQGGFLLVDRPGKELFVAIADAIHEGLTRCPDAAKTDLAEVPDFGSTPFANAKRIQSLIVLFDNSVVQNILQMELGIPSQLRMSLEAMRRRDEGVADPQRRELRGYESNRLLPFLRDDCPMLSRGQRDCYPDTLIRLETVKELETGKEALHLFTRWAW